MMADGIEDGEFWLPSDFLTDDFFLDEAEKRNPGSPETESDEDDYIAGLTRQMAHSFLLDEEKENPKTQVPMATSPQSTLCGAGSWSFKGSPEGPSQVCSPPSTPLPTPKDDALELLYAAAGQVVRLGLLEPPRKPYSAPVLTPQQLQAAQFYQLKQQQLMKQQQQFAGAWGRQTRSRGGGGGGGCGYGEGRAARPLGLSASAWPPLQKQPPPPPQPQPGSGMRAVFLNGARRESAGTGVFLPRRIGSPNEPRKKPACSTVLLPARVVQALNLNLDDMGVHPRHPVGFLLDHDALMARAGPVYSNPRRSPMAAPPAPPVNSNEIRLPPEWTY